MKKKQLYTVTILMLVLHAISVHTRGQNPTDSFPKDPGSLLVYTVQNLSFGAFTQGLSGGTVIISNTGNRSATGTVVPLNLGVQYFQASFEVEAPIGSIISVLNGPDALLTGSNGGTMTMRLGLSDPVTPYSTAVMPPGRTRLNFGGTLTVGNPATSVPGKYTGTFSITFNQE